MGQGDQGRQHQGGVNAAAPADRSRLVRDLRALGLRPGDLAMVHASLRALGPVEGGPAEVLAALLDTVGPEGTLFAFVSWDQSPYLETLDGRSLPAEARANWPAFDAASAPPYREFGAFNRFVCAHPQVRRSAHPDASMAAIGRLADELTRDHSLHEGYGRGSPLERFVAHGGRVLLLGAPLDAVTVLHYAEAIADIPGKRRVRYEVPVLQDGRKVWLRAENFDTNGILDVFAHEGEPDAVERIARDYVAQGHGRRGRVGNAPCHLFEADPIVAYGVRWLQAQGLSSNPTRR
ncbi:aminoglycoside 3-N-acetyltransferase [Ramlibacter sp.]|uniref:aminoglycoside 3-N-acetyltransferase n=1 Tax=Ramlibacter sp. TaxID=1917967 RepID=UPI0039C925D8